MLRSTKSSVAEAGQSRNPLNGSQQSIDLSDERRSGRTDGGARPSPPRLEPNVRCGNGRKTETVPTTRSDMSGEIYAEISAPRMATESQWLDVGCWHQLLAAGLEVTEGRRMDSAHLLVEVGKLPRKAGSSQEFSRFLLGPQPISRPLALLDSLRQRMSLLYPLRFLPGVLLVVCQKLASRDADPCHLFLQETSLEMWREGIQS